MTHGKQQRPCCHGQKPLLIKKGELVDALQMAKIIGAMPLSTIFMLFWFNP
jgi:hypothetical protein